MSSIDGINGPNAGSFNTSGRSPNEQQKGCKLKPHRYRPIKEVTYKEFLSKQILGLLQNSYNPFTDQNLSNRNRSRNTFSATK